MPQILRTTQRLPKETVTLERYISRDGQGAPSYDSPVTFEANVVEYDTTRRAGSGAQFVVKADGSIIRTPLTLYVQGDEAEVPNEQDKIGVDSAFWIVEEKVTVSGLDYTRGEPDHFRLRCRRA